MKILTFIRGSAEDAVLIDFLTTKYAGPENSLMHRGSDEISSIQTQGTGTCAQRPYEGHDPGCRKENYNE